MNRRLFVGNVNPKLTRQDLERFFSKVGAVVSVSIPLDRETREPRGFAFVEFRTSEQATDALESLQNGELGGRQIRLRPAFEDKRRDASNGRPDRSSSRERSVGIEPQVIPEEVDRHQSRFSHHDDAYADERRPRSQKRGKHGSDRKRGRGTRRRLD